MKITRTIIWHSMKDKFRNSCKEVWVLFRNEFTDKLEVQKICRILDAVEDKGWFFEDWCDVDFDSAIYIPIAWTEAFNQDILRTVEEDIISGNADTTS